MNLQLTFEIGKLALSVVDTHLEGKDQDVSVETRYCRSSKQASRHTSSTPENPWILL